MNELPAGWRKNPKGYFEYKMFQCEIKEHERNEKVLLIIAILNWINVFLLGGIIIFRLCNH